MGFLRKKRKSRVCVIGMDGVPYSILLELVRKGIMPSVGKLIDSGHIHKIKASLPEISAVSWTNFMTGSNPGCHGIFGFTDFKKNSYEIRFPNFPDVKKETFWDYLGRENKKIIVINQPSTYPARKINGVLISGFVAIDLAKAVYPLYLKASLEKMDYQIDIDTSKSRENHEFMWKELQHTLDGRLRVFNSLWKEDWDYFEIVITGTDRLHHFIWNAYEDETHPYHQNFLDYYRNVDQVINSIVTSYHKLTGNNEGIYLLSDHGFTSIKQEVYLNVWLEKEGYLSFQNSIPKNLDEISQESRAFALDPNRIYLNLKDKFPRGCVEGSEKQILKEEIKNKLEKLEYEGERVIKKVFDTEDIYSGPYIPMGPDLIVLSEYGFDMKGSIKKKEIFGRSNLQGMHTWDDAFFLAPKDCGQNLSISDLSSIIMKNFNDFNE